MSENEIRIVVKADGAVQAAAEIGTVEEAAKRAGSSGGGMGGLAAGLEDVGRSAEGAERKVTLFRDSQGRLRNESSGLTSDAGKLTADLDEVGRAAEGAGRLALSAGGGFGVGGMGMGSMASAALLLSPALAALPALIAGAAVGAGALAGAFTGVIGALKDYAAQQNTSAATGASAAATAFSNAVAIRNGEQAIADARKAGAQAAVASARQIADAQQGLADAQRQAAIASQSSADQVAADWQRLGQAQDQLTRSQERLTDAEKAGVNTLKDLNLAAEGAANSVVDAQLAVAAAEDVANKARGNSLLTDTQKKAAAQQLVDAQFHLKDAQQKATEAQEAATAANAKGVDGLSAVVSAHDAVTSSTQGVADAQTSLARAQESAANQRISSDEAVGKATQHLADSVKAASDQQAASAESVRRAQQALADTQEQQRLAAGAAGAANDKFAEDMKKLTPSAQAFVLQVLGMKNGLRQLAETAQTATLPGFTQMLKDSSGMFPIVNDAIRTMGGVIGGAAEQFGKLMKSPAFQGDMTKILGQAAGFAKDVASGIVEMVGGIAHAAASAGPIVEGLSKGFQEIMKTGIPAFFQGLTVNAKGTGEAFQAILDLLSGILGPLGTLAGAVSGALGPAFADLVPHLTHFVDLLVQALLPEMPAFSQALDSIARILGQILVIAEPLIPLMAEDFTNTLKILNPLLSTLAKLLESNHGWLGQVIKVMLEMGNPAHLLLTALGWLADHFDSLKATIAAWIGDVKKWWNEAGTWLDDRWHKIGEAASKAWGLIYQYTVKPVKDAVDWVTGPQGFGAVTAFFARVPGDLAKAGKDLFSWIPALFKDAVNLVILGWNSLKFSTPKIHIPGAPSWMDIDSMSFGVPTIPTLKAAGGPASGLTGMGEQGIEMFRVPTGTMVMPHANTAAALQAGRGAGVLQLEWVPGPIGDSFGEAIMELLRHHVRIRAGNGPDSVQAALGQAF